MKLWVGILGIGGIAASLAKPPAAEPAYTFFVTGDANGYLAPCGCSYPMMGGAKRRATAIRDLGEKGRTIVLENGGFIKDIGRQDEIKSETFAQLHDSMVGTAINLCFSESKLGLGNLAALSQLSKGRLTSLSVPKSPVLDIPPLIKKGNFAIAGASEQAEAIAATLGESATPINQAVEKFVSEAQAQGLYPVLMLDGNRQAALRLAQRFPALALIQYKSVGHPPEKLEMEGNTALVTPGDGGKVLVKLTWKDGKFGSYLPIDLGPNFKDDPDATRLYKAYLKRVSDEHLLEKLPRTSKDEYVGGKACFSCHAEAADVWKHSKHAGALATLEHEGHDRDPDCVSCHVVGLDSLNGFVSRMKTPDLASVGCESCHGAGKAHSAAPKLNPMPKIGEKACMSCHRPENSPRFDFSTYWAKIKHK